MTDTPFPDGSVGRLLSGPEIPDGLAPLSGETAWLLPRLFQTQSLRITLPNFWAPGIAEWHRIEFFWDDIYRAQVRLHLPQAGDFPQTFTIPEIDLSRPGIFKLHYVVYLEPLPNPAISDPIWVNLDKEAPNFGARGGPLIFPAQVIAGGVTDAYLAANSDQVQAQVPRWPDLKEQDRVECYWFSPIVSAIDAETPVTTLTIEPRHVNGDPIIVTFTGDMIRGKGNGNFNATYVLFDRAGNENDESVVERVAVALTQPPAGLLRPRVPLADVDGLINRADAAAGVRVLVDAYTSPEPGDEVTASWNSTDLGTVPITGASAFPVEFSVPWSTIRAYGEDAPYGATVTYRVRRGGNDPQSPANTFNVDLRIPGPPNPDPDPINPALALVDVYGGGANPVLNLIRPADINLPATATVLLYTNPQPDEVMQLFWAGAPVPGAQYTVQAGDSEFKPIAFIIPWALIDGASSPVPVYYTITNGTNPQQSRNTAVVVRSALLPNLPIPQFPDRSNNFYINCCTAYRPWLGIRVRVPMDSRFEVGDTLGVQWKGYQSTNLVHPVAGMVNTFEKVLVAADLTGQYVEFLIESYDQWIVPIATMPKPDMPGSTNPDGSASVVCELTKTDGGYGVSELDYVKLSLVAPGSTQACREGFSCPSDVGPDEAWAQLKG